MANSFAFISHAATGLAANAVTPAAGQTRLRLPFDVEITANGVAQAPRVAVSSELRGPGDIVSIDRAMISRVEPETGLRGFEPNYFPLVEFVDADFPWRFSLDPPGGPRRKPWIVVIALLPEEFGFIDRGEAPLARIQVKDAARSLPDLGQSWACAHVQLDLATASATPAGVLANDPANSFARLMCPRRLEPRKAYTLFLVPAYEAGRLAGLGRRAVASPFAAPAWTQASGPVELPFYHQWRFTTDALEDIELLMRRLRGVRADEADEAGAPERASAARPGYYLDYAKPGASFEIQAAMRQPEGSVEGFNTDPALVDRMVATLDTVIAGENELDEDDEDPLVAFPPHGFRYKPETEVSRARAEQNEWFDRLNLDLKFRHAAGLGARVVRENQELFAQICWEQYEEIAAANERLARLQVAAALTGAIADRHFARLATDVALALAEPMQPFAELAVETSAAAALRSHGAPGSFAGRDLRHLAAKRAVAGAPGGRIVPAPRIPGDLTSSAPETRWSVERARRESGLLVDRGLGGRVLEALSGVLGREAFAAAPRPEVAVVAVEQFASRSMVEPVAAALRAMPTAKARYTLTGLTEREVSAIRPVWRAPVVPLPTSGFLQQVDRAALLSGVHRLPENTVSVFEENRSFLEAFLVGMNHEMNNELRWREFPTDMRGTIFRRFWDRHRPPDDPVADDIAEIHTWSGSLGKQFPPADADRRENLIVVIRGEVVRKLGHPILVINFAIGPKFELGKGSDHAPVFSGKLGPDIAYFGFDVARAALLDPAVRDKVYLVIYEPVGRLRFGLDVGTAAVRQARRDALALSHAFPIVALQRPFTPLPPRIVPPLVPIPGQPARWDDLSWSHMQLDGAGYIDFSKTIVIQGQPDYWGAGKTAASLARSFWQKPIAAVLPLARVV